MYGGNGTSWRRRACAVACVLAVTAVLLAASACASGKDAASSKGNASDGGYVDASYAALADGSLVGKAVHLGGIVDYPYHDDGSLWQGYLISVDEVDDDLVTAWHEVAEGSEPVAGGSMVEIWGTLEALSYVDVTGETVDIPYVAIERMGVVSHG